MGAGAKPLVLVVDDDTGHLSTLKTIIKSWGYLVEGVDDGEIAVEKVKEKAFDLIIMDVRMTIMGGIEALSNIKGHNPSIPVLIMTAYSSVESAVDAMKAGAYDYLTKPLDFDELKLVIERAMEHTHLKSENELLKEMLHSGAIYSNIIGTSPPMKKLMEMVTMIAPSEATALITGESGTGKELIARAIHEKSNRKKGQLVSINCAAIPESLLESELFGHEKGAFTGADKRREGRFMQADKGTIFLDEVGEMPMAMQAKLLRVVQEREIQRVGGDKTITVNVRVIAATNQNLSDLVSSGKFREDLYYRLNVVSMNIPPLRERIEDIPLLAHHFLNIYSDKNKKTIKGFTPIVMDMLLKYNWPGNVREMENAIERAVILSLDEYINEKVLPMTIAEFNGKEERENRFLLSSDESQPLEEIEKEMILSTLKAVEGNKSETARKLGINRRTLYNKLQKYGLD